MLTNIFNSLRYGLCVRMSFRGLLGYQNEYIEEHIKRHGRQLDYYERKYASFSKRKLSVLFLNDFNFFPTKDESGKPVWLINLLLSLRKRSD